MSSVSITPEESITFSLVGGNSSQASLVIKNESSTSNIAFKVKTTRPMRYLVRPNQGLVGKNESSTVVIVLQQKDCDELLRLDAEERNLSKDKFLVQNIDVEDDFYDSTQSKPAKEISDILNVFWSNASKENVQNKKLKCDFKEEVKEISGSTSEGAETETSRSAAEKLSSALLSQGTKDKSKKNDHSGMSVTSEEMISEVATLRKKYDELVAFTVQLTAQRDNLMNELDKRQQLRKSEHMVEKSKNLTPDSSLRQRKTTQSGQDNTGASETSTSEVKAPTKSFGLFELLVCGIIFFIIGRYYRS